jgi:hypothetical protein
VKLAMNELAQALEEIIGGRSVEKVAQEWSSPEWTLRAWRLRDILRGHTRAPRDRRDLQAIAKGSGLPYERVVLMAFHANGNGDTPPSPPEGGSSCRPAHGPLSKDRSGSTS